MGVAKKTNLNKKEFLPIRMILEEIPIDIRKS